MSLEVEEMSHAAVGELLRSWRVHRRLIPLPYQNDLTIYGKEVMDLTICGFRSM